MPRKQLIITGRVQGVYYRATACQKAQQLQLIGWIKNLEDGHVMAQVQGPEDSIEQFTAWCRKGPPLSRVDNIEIMDLPETDEKNFVVIR